MSDATDQAEYRRRKGIHYKTALGSFKVELETFEGSKKERILELAKLLEESGHPKETISERVGDDLEGYLSKQYVRKVLGDEFKNANKSREQAHIETNKEILCATSSATDTKEQKQPIAITNSGSQELDQIYGGKTFEQMKKEADQEIQEDKEETLENPRNLLPDTNTNISDTPPEMRQVYARISELEEALRIQKEEAKQKGDAYFELKRKYLRNAPENLQRENMELKRMINNLQAINENSNSELIKTELNQIKEVELYKLKTEKVSQILLASKNSERTFFLRINEKLMEIIEAKTDKEMHRIQSQRKQEAALVSEAKAEVAALDMVGNNSKASLSSEVQSRK